jgi:hypothetical protein
MSSNQETEKYVRMAATVGCTIMSDGNYQLCDWMFGGDYEKAIEKAFSLLPDCWKAVGVTDYQYIAEPIFKLMQRIWKDSHDLVDQTWDETRKQLGMPTAPSPASHYLDDWLIREGWMEPVEITSGEFMALENSFWGSALKQKIALTPVDGPWAWHSSSDWPTVCDSGCENLFRGMLAYLYGRYRVKHIADGVENTLKYITATLSNTEYSFDPGLIAKAVWVHGHALEAETPEQLTKTNVKGWGVRFHGKKDTLNWFHATLTVPSTQDNHNLILSKVFVLFKTEKSNSQNFSAMIKYIHIYDGAHKIISLDNLFLSGEHDEHLDALNCHLLYPFPSIKTGLGISIGVHFLNSNTSISFSSIGADFIVSND